MHSRPIVLLDCDGPLSCFTSGYLEALEKETGMRHLASEVDQWSIADCDFFTQAAKKINVAPRDLKARVDRHVSVAGFCAGLKVQPGARDAVYALRQLADVYVVTSPWDSSPTWQYERLHWIAEHFEIPRARVVQTGTKHIIRGDFFVDDKTSHVIEWGLSWPHGIAFLFDMGHNQAAHQLPSNAERAKWDEIIDRVRACV
jgi:5'(3')-deoxyribonucleotidase